MIRLLFADGNDMHSTVPLRVPDFVTLYEKLFFMSVIIFPFFGTDAFGIISCLCLSQTVQT